MNEQLKLKMEEIAEAFRKAGMSDEQCYMSNNTGSIHLYFKETVRTTYLGTYLNWFSIADPCLLWSDEYAIEKAEVVIEPVYRHNGSAEDVSVGIWFYPWHSSVRLWPQKFDYEVKNKPEYVKIVKELSPFDYIEHSETLTITGTSASCERTAKLSKTASKKSVTNAVEKTMKLVRAFVPNDHSKWARNPKDYHMDTTLEHNKWIAAGRPCTWGLNNPKAN